MAESGEQPGIACPHCGGGVAVEVGERAEVVGCPHCGEAFVVPAVDGTLLKVAYFGGGAADDAVAAAAGEEPDDLDGLRIRQVFQMRRGMYRTRRYWLVGAGLCVVAAGQIVWKFFSPVGWVAMSGVQVVVLASAFLIGGILCMRRAWELGRAAGRSVLGEPEGTPDFSRLSDGSQHWRNLEAMGGEDRGEGR